MLTGQLGRDPHRRVPADQRGMALGINQITALAGQFLGLLAGGLLAVIDWRAVFWVSVPIGVVGTIWSYRSLREIGTPRPARIDWLGNVDLHRRHWVAAGRDHLRHPALRRALRPAGRTRWCWAASSAASRCWWRSASIGDPDRRSRCSSSACSGSAPSPPATSPRCSPPIARGGLQFMLIIWLQGIWLPLHGYDYADTPLWAGIYLLPLTVGLPGRRPGLGLPVRPLRRAAVRHRRAGRWWPAPSSACCCCRWTSRYPVFALLLVRQRHRAGHVLRAEHLGDHGQRPGQPSAASPPACASRSRTPAPSLSIGVFFSLMIAGPGRLAAGHARAAACRRRACPPTVATQVGHAAAGEHAVRRVPGHQPDRSHLLGAHRRADTLPPANVAVLTGTRFFPELISGPFHHGLVIVFTRGRGDGRRRRAGLAAARHPPHPRLLTVPGREVAMSDAMTAETIRITGHGGDEIEAYLGRPLDRGPCGGIVVIHHMPGYDEATKAMVRSFAAAGYAALCPNLHYREAPGVEPCRGLRRRPSGRRGAG